MNTIGAQTARVSSAARLRLILGVFKLRIGFLIMLTALAGLAISPAPAPPAWQVLVMALAVLVASASSGAFNQFIEADIDRSLASASRQRS